MSVGRVGIARLHSPAPDEASEVLGGYLAITMHQHDHGVAGFRLHDQRLDDVVQINPESRRPCRRSSARLVAVEMGNEVDPGVTERPDGHGDGDLHAKSVPTPAADAGLDIQNWGTQA